MTNLNDALHDLRDVIALKGFTAELVEEIAEDYGINPVLLSRKFTEQYNATPAEYVAPNVAELSDKLRAAQQRAAAEKARKAREERAAIAEFFAARPAAAATLARAAASHSEVLRVNGRFSVRNPARYRAAVQKVLDLSEVEVKGKLVPGVSVSHLIAVLRDQRFQVPSRLGDQEDLFKALGFGFEYNAKAGKNTHKGHQYIIPCRAVIAA